MDARALGINYFNTTHTNVNAAMRSLYQMLGLPIGKDMDNAESCATIDILELARRRYSEDFAAYLDTAHTPLVFVAVLQESNEIPLLAHSEPDAAGWRVRLALANLADRDFAVIGQRMKKTLDDFHVDFAAKWRA